MSRDQSVPADPAAVKCDLATEILRSFGTLRFAATGWSMLPAFWPGDTLVVDRVSPDQVRIGDVALVGRDGRLCAHRVVSMAESSGNSHWITQGDAMPAPDRPVTETELLGRVAYVIRAGKRIAVPAELSVVEHLIAKIVQHSFSAARALVYLHRLGQTPKESVLPCQG
jgi:signal peptidase I